MGERDLLWGAYVRLGLNGGDSGHVRWWWWWWWILLLRRMVLIEGLESVHIHRIGCLCLLSCFVCEHRPRAAYATEYVLPLRGSAAVEHGPGTRRGLCFRSTNGHFDIPTSYFLPCEYTLTPHTSSTPGNNTQRSGLDDYGSLLPFPIHQPSSLLV